MTDADSAPSNSEELRGLMLHPGDPTVYVCLRCAFKVGVEQSHNGGEKPM